MREMQRLTPQQQDTKRVIETAHLFTVRRFEGRGQYLKADTPTLIEAAAVARHWGKGPYGHGPLVYAVNPSGRCVHVEEREFPKMHEDDLEKPILIDWREPGNLRFTDFDTKELADAACPSEGGAAVIANKSDLMTLNPEVLVTIYNNLRRGGAPITAFQGTDEAVARVFTLLCAPRDRAVGNTKTESPVPAKEGDDSMATSKKGKGTKAPKKAKAPKAPKVAKAKKAAAPKKAGNGHDAFGLRVGSKASEAARMMARDNGASMEEVKEKIGDTKYGLVKKLKEAGHKVKHEEGRYYLTAK